MIKLSLVIHKPNNKHLVFKQIQFLWQFLNNIFSTENSIKLQSTKFS